MYSLRLAPVTPLHPSSIPKVDSLLFSAISVGLVLLFLMPLVVTEWTVSPFIFGKAIYARALILVLVALWIVLRFRDPAYDLPRSWVLLFSCRLRIPRLRFSAYRCQHR